MKSLFKQWGLDSKYSYIGQTITKTQFKKQVQLSSKELLLLEQDISKIKVAYVLNPSNINITAYQDEQFRFSGVMYLTIELKGDKHVEGVAKMIHQSFPDPVCLILIHEHHYWISTAIKRINLQVQNKVIVEGYLVTNKLSLNESEANFLESLALKELPHTDFYAFYKTIHSKIFNFIHREKIGAIQGHLNSEQQALIQERVKQIEEKELEQKKIIQQIKKETQFNRKLQLNEEAIRLQQEIEQLKMKKEGEV